MEFWNIALLIASALLLASIVASAISTRVGVPLLLVFLVLGMIAGEDGPGGIPFSDFETAYAIGTVALAVIIFDGGLRTRRSRFRVALWPAISLAVVGVFVSAALLATFAAFLFGFSWLEGLLLGAIIGSTDAAAVFGTLRTQGASLKQRVAATLEIESGSNDPMAILLTVLVLELLAAGAVHLDALALLSSLARQFLIGGVMGVVGGQVLVLLINRLNLISGLYPLLAAAGGLLVFAITAHFDGSGFLAIYLAGVVLGNARLQSRQNVLRVHDGLAWLSQIAMFLILGLLVTPSDLLDTAWQGLAIALFLMGIARPVAVALSLLPFRFPWREQLYIGWMGLRGAVPIVLATFPVMYGLENASFYFNITFFVVLVSLLFQGMTVAPAARLLGIEAPPVPRPAQRITLDVPGHYEHEMVGFTVQPDCPACGRHIAALALPEGVVASALLRDGQPQPQYDTALQTGDFVYLIARRQHVDFLCSLFDPHAGPEYLDESRFFGEFTLNGDATLGDVAAVYGVEVPRDAAELTLHQWLSKAFHQRTVVGDSVPLGSAWLVVREIDDDRITRVGLRLPRP
ncbi:potassium/proton antiporter [Elongatibacter sediminis]|uniref:Potassium/proton antiporter n=1 Tax=Elongatibacter sediminis TaxID=3119006 RepID=A0AAW9RC06_9GAMM